MEYKIHVKVKNIGKVLDKLNELGYDFRSSFGNSLREGTEEDIKNFGESRGYKRVWLYIDTDGKWLQWDFTESSGFKIRYKTFILMNTYK